MATPAAIPGQLLGTISSHSPGIGTHVYDSKIYASVTGQVVTVPAASKSEKPTLLIQRSSAPLPTTHALSSTGLPSVGTAVLCRITRVQQRQATVLILVVNPTPGSVTPYTTSTNDELQFQALLRKEDVRSYEKDRVVMNDSFRVGDIVRAFVISLGDERNYYISTAGNEYGVAVATSEEGNAMVPASWKEMRDVVTGRSEARKVAKPV